MQINMGQWRNKMDYMEKITELRASKAKLNEQAQALVT